VDKSSAQSAIELCGVSYRAGEQLILDSVDWSIRRGEHWAILGPNGAGKTTLLKLASGYLWPNAGGSILRFGEPLVDLAQLRSSIGWVTHRLVEWIPPREPALDTVASGRFGQFGLRRQLLGSRLTVQTLDAARGGLLRLGSEELADRPFGVLSQGEQQKVLLARSLMAQPLIIFLDEPCAGLDPGARERFLADLERLASAESSISLVLVTHHLEEIMPAFARLLVLSEGRVQAQGTTADLVTSDLIESLYRTRPKELHCRDGRFWPIW
jgi:iron complex transport system ATP-binding protein